MSIMEKFEKVCEKTRRFAPIPLRLALGIIFTYHGHGKVFGGVPGFAESLGRMGMEPALPLAWLTALTECLGGIALILGFLTPVAASGLAITMIVAITRVHWTRGLSGPGGYEFPLSLLAGALALLLGGPGCPAVDCFLKKCCKCRPAK